ncbi:guanylate kinase [Bacillus phage Kirov]|uniref:Guanylate kinase n=1 Tax=Bacillus phage Kirov TaxID=2783539 RepID=A0A7U3NKG2_9CAUD|nr:guanylate kinase [Bacillus phage Kirov]QOV08314.1 guanylate kinase [Bacillus phage Kirov]
MALILVTAPSGAGKTSIMEIVQNYLGKHALLECVSDTTRKMREGESHGRTYYYRNEETFQKMVDNDEFAEHVEYDGNRYGITVAEINGRLAKAENVYIIVNHEGYLQVKEKFPKAVGIFLHMSKEDCMANMLLRGDSIENALSRIALYDDEMKNRNDYDYVVKNVRGQQATTRNIIINIISQNQN